MISLPFIEGILNGNTKIVLFVLKKNSLPTLETVNSYLRENGASNLIKISEIQQLESLPLL
jgi:hypothetical protein